MAHTPGPWHIEPWEDCISDGAPDIPVIRGERCGVAAATRYAFDENGDPATEANARLIAAAPDLLQAIKNIAPVFTALQNLFPLLHGQISEDGIAEFEKRVSELEAAVAKAEGV